MRVSSQKTQGLLRQKAWQVNSLSVQMMAKSWLCLAFVLLGLVLVIPSLGFLTLPGMLLALLSLCLGLLGWVFLRLS